MAEKGKNPRPRSSGKGAGALRILASLAQFVSPEMLIQIMDWVRNQHFSDKFINIVDKLAHLTSSNNPLATINAQCDAVEELIATKSNELSDDAPITQWHDEVEKIRRGVMLLEKMPKKDGKKAKELKQRSKKLFDSAFLAAVN